MAATDLMAWAKLIGFTDQLACCEIVTFRYGVLHVAARIARGAGARAPDKPGCALIPPGAWHKPSLPSGPATAPHSPKPSHPCTDDQKASTI
jgi:hypothetical protein